MREFLIPLFNWNHHPRHHHLYHCHHDFNHENTIHVFFLQAGREELLLEMYSNMMDSMKAFWTHTLELLPIIQILPNTTRRLQSRLKLSRAQWHFFRLPSFRLIPFHIWSSFAKKNIVDQFDRMHKSVGNWTWFQFWFFKGVDSTRDQVWAAIWSLGGGRVQVGIFIVIIW